MNMINLLPILTLDKSASEDIRRNATMLALGASNPVIGAVATRSLLESAVQAEQSNARLRAEVAQLRSDAAPREEAGDPGALRDEAAALRAKLTEQEARMTALQTEVGAKDAKIAALATESAEQDVTIGELKGQIDALKAAPATAPASGQQADTPARPVK